MKNTNEIFTSLIFLAVSLAITIVSFASLNHLNSKNPAYDQAQEVLYLPSGAGLRFMSFGYRNALSDGLWLNTVDYFGKHFSSDKNYRWLDHMCNLVVDLNPKVYDPYYFCSTMLAWENKSDAGLRQAITLLSKAINAYPDDWFFYYHRGFYYMYFLHDKVKSHNDFLTASQKPGAHPICARLAAENMSESEGPKLAVAFLKSMMRRTTDKYQLEAFQNKIDEILSKAEKANQL